MISFVIQASLFVVTTVGGVMGIVKGIELLAAYNAIKSLKK